MGQWRFDPTNTLANHLLNTGWMSVGKMSTGSNDTATLTFNPISVPEPIAEVRMYVTWDNGQAGGGTASSGVHCAKKAAAGATEYTYNVSGSTGSASVVLPAGVYSTSASWQLNVQGAASSANGTNKGYAKAIYLIVSSETAIPAPTFITPPAGRHTINASPRVVLRIGTSTTNQQRLYVQGSSGWVNSVDHPQYFSVSGWLANNTTTMFMQAAALGTVTLNTYATSSLGAISPTASRSFTRENPSWTDATLVRSQTQVKAAHINDLRTRLNTTRAFYGLAAQTWTETISPPGRRIKGSLFSFQTEAFRFVNQTWHAMAMEQGHGATALLMDMGTGKSLTTIAIADFWNGIGQVQRMLVVAPLSVCPVWQEEFEKFAGFPYTLAVLEGSRKAEQLQAIPKNGLQVAVVNYESAWRLENELAAWKPDIIVCDESSRIKNPQAKQSKAMHRLGAMVKYRLILTGTPVQNNPLDFFSQYKFLDNSIFGKSYYAFRARYAVMGGYGNHQIVAYNHLDELVSKAHSIAFRVTKAEALDLPETTDVTRYVNLEPEARRIYDGLKRDALAELPRGTVSATNILTKLLRLLQVTGGFIREDEGHRAQCVSRAKLMELDAIIEDVLAEGNKMVVFARFLPELDAISDLLEEKGLRFSIIRGDVHDRAEQIRNFQTDPDVKVFVAQIQTAAMGITLTAANVAVFYSVDYNLANYLQCRARIHRNGQKNHCTYIHLIARGTDDELVMKGLMRKEDVARLLVDNWRSLLKPTN